MSSWRAPIDVPEQAQKSEVLLVDRSGRPLLVRDQRPIGFQRPTEDVQHVRRPHRLVAREDVEDGFVDANDPNVTILG